MAIELDSDTMRNLLKLLMLMWVSTFSFQTMAQQSCQSILIAHTEIPKLTLLYHDSGKMLNYKASFSNTMPLKSQVRIATYNMKKFEDLDANPELATREELQRRKSQAQLIKELNPDFQILSEVGSENALKQFVKTHLNNEYVPMLVEGNERSMNIALMVRRNLQVAVRWKSYKYYKSEEVSDAHSFTRDLPVGIVFEFNERGTVNLNPKFIIIGTHYKSKIPSGEAINLTPEIRQKQIEATLAIIQKNQIIYGKNIPIIIAGDFNENILLPNSDLQPLIDFGFRDSFDISKEKTPIESRYTHFTFSKNGTAHRAQIDGVLVYHKDSNVQVHEALVVNHRDEDGNTFVPPQNMEQRNELPSDHLGVLSVLEFPTH